jgi:hypothetical protein
MNRIPAAMKLCARLLLAGFLVFEARADDLPDLAGVKRDLVVPKVSLEAPAPGVRSVQTTAGWEGTQVHHTVYLPLDWKAGDKLPVIVEYAGNGNFKNAYGDVSDGSVEGCRLGYGISGGKGFICVCLPYVEVKDGVKQNAVLWWGDVEESKRYCIATVHDVCARYGGDEHAVVLCGFSRGAIGCNFIGLNDDKIAGLWRAFICHSHYDGVIEQWPYPGADRASALTRLRRLGNRPQFISQEGSTAATEQWLRSTGIAGLWTFEPLPYRNHSANWALCDLPIRRKARAWLAAALKE